MMSEAARRGRAAFTRGAWSEVYAQLRAADDPAGCSLADLELPAVAAYLPGRDDECADAWGRAYQGHLERGDPIRAARCAFWLGWGLFYKGQMAQCAGWFARAQRLVDDCGRQCAEEGLLLVPQACGDLFGKGDAERAFSTFSSVRDIGQFFGDDDVIAFGLLGYRTGAAPPRPAGRGARAPRRGNGRRRPA